MLPPSKQRARPDLIAVGVGIVLVVVAFVVPHLGLKTVTPLINATRKQFYDFADTAPIFGWWDAHVGWGTPFAILIAVGVVLQGRQLAARLPWRTVVFGTWLTTMAWAFSLAMVDGWQRGFAGRLTATHEYLVEVPGITDIPTMLRTFASRILDYQPDSWTTHTSGHPPGAILTFVWLDRLGLHGGAWAGLWCLLIGSSATAAILVAVRALGDEAMARRAAPFLMLAPSAIWIAVSADGYFAGVTAWGLALLAIAAAQRRWVPAVAAGLLLGWAMYLNYGLGLIAIPAVAVLIIARNARPLIGAVLGALVVVAAFTTAGFWWFDGYQLVQQRYWQGIASARPFAYWSWANIASLACAVGFAAVAAVHRSVRWSELKTRSPIPILVVAVLIATLCADLSALSKAETERIWLSFELWIVAGAALLPLRHHRYWLIAQAVGALAINHVILTNW